jgi:hypothetical protein
MNAVESFLAMIVALVAPPARGAVAGNERSVRAGAPTARARAVGRRARCPEC